MGKIKRLEDLILRRIGVLSRSIHYISDIKYRKMDLQKGQFIFLTRVCENPGINFSELSNMLRVDKTTTTKAVKKLIKAGYIIKEQDTEDKRIHNLRATPKGMDTYETVIGEENRSIDICFEGFTQEERELVNELIEKMAKNTESEWEKIKGRGDRKE